MIAYESLCHIGRKPVAESTVSLAGARSALCLRFEIAESSCMQTMYIILDWKDTGTIY